MSAVPVHICIVSSLCFVSGSDAALACRSLGCHSCNACAAVEPGYPCSCWHEMVAVSSMEKG